MMKKHIPFAEYNIWSMWNSSVLSLHFCDRFIGCLEQEVTSQIIHRAWYFTYVSYAFGRGCGSLSAVILLDPSLEVSCHTAESRWRPDLLTLHLWSFLFRYGLISKAVSWWLHCRCFFLSFFIAPQSDFYQANKSSPQSWRSSSGGF